MLQGCYKSVTRVIHGFLGAKAPLGLASVTGHGSRVNPKKFGNCYILLDATLWSYMDMSGSVWSPVILFRPMWSPKVLHGPL